MWTLQPSLPQKIGIVIYGLAAGLCTALGTSAVLLAMGIAISLLAQSTGWIHLGEYQPWLPMIGLEYGFFLGIVLGVLVCWKFLRSRLGDQS